MTSSPGPVVLIVDDAEDCVATMDIALQAVPGIVIRSAASAEAALAALENEPICAVITDLQLPGMSGLDLIASMRGHAKWNMLPIVAVSAAADAGLPKAALESGANAFFPKPFSPAALRKKLEELIYAR